MTAESQMSLAIAVEAYVPEHYIERAAARIGIGTLQSITDAITG